MRILLRRVVMLCLATSVAFVGVTASKSTARRPIKLASAALGAPSRYLKHVLHLRVPIAGSQTREVVVWRPSIPDSRSLPVVYFLHGVPGSARDVETSGIPAALAKAVQAGATPYVLVAPDGWGERHDDTEWADAADGSEPIESFVTHVVIDAVEGAQRRDRAHRAIAGFSMGGYGAINLAMRHPDLFGQAISFDGYFHIDDPDSMFGDREDVRRANDPSHNVANAGDLRILLLEGAQDDTPVVHGEAARFKSVLDKARVDATLAIAPGSHTWSYVVSQFTRMTDFLEGSWPMPASLTP